MLVDLLGEIRYYNCSGGVQAVAADAVSAADTGLQAAQYVGASGIRYIPPLRRVKLLPAEAVAAQVVAATSIRYSLHTTT